MTEALRSVDFRQSLVEALERHAHGPRTGPERPRGLGFESSRPRR